MKTLLAVILLVSASAVAQTTAGLAPIGGQFFDASGHPLSGGKIYTCSSGSDCTGGSNRLATYTSSTGGTQAQNPIILDSGGRADVWLGPSAYRLILKTSADVSVHTWDGVTAPTLSSNDVTIPSGKAFNLASGSSTSLAADLLPSGSHNLGSSQNHWSQGYIDFLFLANHVTLAASNSYDSASQSTPWRNQYAFGGYVNKQYFCGTAGTFSSNCYTVIPHVDTNNSYLAMTDDAGTEVMRWSKKEAGTDTLLATFPTMMVYAPVGLSVPGIYAVKVGNDQQVNISANTTFTFQNGSELALGTGSTLTPPSGDAALNGTYTCSGAQNIYSIRVSNGILTGYTCH